MTNLTTIQSLNGIMIKKEAIKKNEFVVGEDIIVKKFDDSKWISVIGKILDADEEKIKVAIITENRSRAEIEIIEINNENKDKFQFETTTRENIELVGFNLINKAANNVKSHQESLSTAKKEQQELEKGLEIMYGKDFITKAL